MVLRSGTGNRPNKRVEKEEAVDYSDQDTDQKGEPKFREQADSLPFLKGADPGLVKLFEQVFVDPDIPSERRRQEEIHLLAVSYLSGKQLNAFNQWSTERRKRIRLREQQLRQLSRPARDALKHLSLLSGGLTEQKTEALRLPADVKNELRVYAQRRMREWQSS